MQQQSSNSNILACGAPHFRSIAKQHRHANYNLEKALNEWLDNVVKLATRIDIITQVDLEGRLQELKVSDNYALGFVNIQEQGTNNPFNMGHIKSGHDDDSETSEFGCGGKAAALSISNHMTVVTKVKDHCYEVICDFIKMEREEDVNASYNPKKREISVDDYSDVHPFEFGSSIVLSKILGTICQQTTQQKLTERLKKGISETYSKLLKKDIMEIYVNGEPVEQEINFFLDPKCMPFTIRKSLFILENDRTKDKIYLIQKIVDRVTWQQYNKAEDKWEAFKSVKEADEFRDAKRRDGYTYVCQQSSNIIDGSCVKMESTFVFYSDMVHTNEPFDHLLPQDLVSIYKDNRKYGKKSLVKHNNGINNYTLHKIEFNSKKIGKELGITFNKDITMECNNDLIMAIKAAIKDNRKEFNADTSTALNSKLCDKALKLGVIALMTCSKNKLSKTHREKRELDEKKACQKENPVFRKPTRPSASLVADSLLVVDSLVADSLLVASLIADSLIVDSLKPVVPIATVSRDDDSSDYSSSDETVSSKSSSDSKTSVDSITLVIEEIVSETKSEEIVVSEATISEVLSEIKVNSDLEQSKAILINVSKLIMDITASDDFNISLDSSKQIADMIQKLLNL